MDVNKNSYTFTFAAVMVVVVAAILSFAATSLKPMQDKNVEQEKMQSILRSIRVDVDRDKAADLYSQYVKQELVVSGGELKEGVDAFTVEMSKEVEKPVDQRNAPLYIAEKDGQTFYIIPLRGKGLWGPIWGYMSLQGDANTVYGTVFDHKGETPGLGAEIVTPMFTEQFVEKKILDADKEFVSIQVMKGTASGDYQVDGISGGTITSVGVEEMIEENVQAYYPFLLSYSKEQGAVKN